MKKKASLWLNKVLKACDKAIVDNAWFQGCVRVEGLPPARPQQDLDKTAGG